MDALAAYPAPRLARLLKILLVVSYEIMEGKPPFEGDSFEAIGYRILREVHPPLSGKTQEALPGFQNFLDGCMEKDPELRIQDGQEAFRLLQEVAAGASVDYSPPVVRPAWRRRTRSRRTPMAMRLFYTFLLALGVLTVFSRGLFPTDPILMLEFPMLSNEDNPSWNPFGDRVAYFVGDHPRGTLVIRETRTDAGPEFHTIPEEMQYSQVAWSKNDSILVLHGTMGAALYNVHTRAWCTLAETGIRDAKWSDDGQRLVWANQQGGIKGLEVVQNISWDDVTGTADLDIRPIAIEGLPTPLDNLGVYYPVFMQNDSRIAFVVFRRATNLGIWSVPAEGGEAIRLLSAEDYFLWDLRWDPVRSELLAKEMWGPGLYRLILGGLSGVVSRVVRHEFPPGEVDAIWAYDYHAVSGQYILLTANETWWLWQSLLEPGRREFEPLVTEFRQTMAPAVSPDQKTIYFTGVGRESGSLIRQYDLATGICNGLHETTVDFGTEIYASVDPSEGRYAIFRAAPGDQPGTLHYCDLRQGRIRSLPGLSEPGHIETPYWSLDGRYIYYRFIPMELDAPRLFLRIEVERSGSILSIGIPDTLLSGRDMYHPLPGPNNRYLVYQRGQRMDASLMILDTHSGDIGELVKGECPALSPSRDKVYFRSGDSIWCLSEWWLGSDRVMEPQHVVDFPAGVKDLGIGASLAVGDNAIYAVLTYESPGSIRVYRVP